MPRSPTLAITLLSAALLAAVAANHSTVFASGLPGADSRSATADSALRAEVAALNAAMVAAFHRDPATVARFYADSAKIVGPKRQTVAGRAAIDHYWAGIRRPATWTLDVVDVGGSRAEAYQIGVSSLTSTGSDGQSRTYVCDFVVIWKRQADGTLRIALDLYN
jgi:ketosteroid isomerase-like protein